MASIGTIIKEARIRKGMTQEDLADISRINLRTIQRIENEENEPRPKTLNLLSDVLDLEFDALVSRAYRKKARSLGDLFAEGFFLLVLNFVFMGIFGYLTLDSHANLNSKFAAILLSFLIPYFIVYHTAGMHPLERTLKFGIGFILYFVLVMVMHGFPLGFGSLLFPCLGISLAVLYYGNGLLRKEPS